MQDLLDTDCRMPESGFISRLQDVSSAQSQDPGQLHRDIYIYEESWRMSELPLDTLPTLRKTKKLNQAWKHVFANPSYSGG